MKLIVGTNDLLTLMPELAKEWDYSRNYPDRPECYTVGSATKAWWKCSMGHCWLAMISNRVNGQKCPYCFGRVIYTYRFV